MPLAKAIRTSQPLLVYSGTSSGQVPFTVGATITFAPGTYTFTVTVPGVVKMSAAGAGAIGQTPVANGGVGGGGGAVGIDGAIDVSLLPGVLYQVQVPASGASGAAFIGINGGAKFIEMGSTVTAAGGVVITGIGIAGGVGGQGGQFNTVDPNGAPGTILPGGAGGGGGGATQGSIVMGVSGSGGGMTNGGVSGGGGGRGKGVSVAGNADAAFGGGGGNGGGGAGGASGHGAAGLTRTA